MGDRKFLSFTGMLGILGRGRTAAELDRQLAQVSTAASETGKPGKITLTLTVKPNADGQVEIVDKIAVSVPQPERGKSLFFVMDSGVLSREDPNQTAIPMPETKRAGSQ